MSTNEQQPKKGRGRPKKVVQPEAKIPDSIPSVANEVSGPSIKKLHEEIVIKRKEDELMSETELKEKIEKRMSESDLALIDPKLALKKATEEIRNEIQSDLKRVNKETLVKPSVSLVLLSAVALLYVAPWAFAGITALWAASQIIAKIGVKNTVALVKAKAPTAEDLKKNTIERFKDRGLVKEENKK